MGSSTATNTMSGFCSTATRGAFRLCGEDSMISSLCEASTVSVCARDLGLSSITTADLGMPLLLPRPESRTLVCMDTAGRSRSGTLSSPDRTRTVYSSTELQPAGHPPVTG